MSGRSKMSMSLAVSLLVTLSGTSLPGQQIHDMDECGSELSCGGCIARHPSCAWCADESLPEGLSHRCVKVEKVSAKCRNVESPSNQVQIDKDAPLSGIVSPGQEELAIQLRPQVVQLRLRPHVAESFRVSFQQAQDYPVDLYYLMDLSYTMLDDKGKLEQLGGKLAREMGKITRNFRLGFGSFVDKKLLPFHQTHPAVMDSPCEQCTAPYGFHNNMPLSTKAEQFEIEVRRAQISGNIDTPEGGLDALMQVALCKKEIGWRSTSRKIIVFSTDDDYHFAGDGKLAGLLEPNDGRCHLVDGWYVSSTEQDYPSMAQLKNALDQERINVIYAVTRDQFDKYVRLKDRLGSGFVGILSRDSANVVKLVRGEYEKITSIMELDHNAPSFLRVNFYSTCNNGPRRKVTRCSDLKVDTKITFEVEVELVSCPPKEKRTGEERLTFQIFVPGLKDAVTVGVDPLCRCGCEDPSRQEYYSPACSGGRGALQCGICLCYEGWQGNVCQCNATSFDPTQDTAACLRHPDDQKVCSGRGMCQCGRCICHQNPPHEISGDYCEYDNFSCDKASNGKVCGGADHGRCGKDGICECFGEYEGPDCMCSVRKDKCLSEDGELCSGNGECRCNKCHCTARGYSGATCGECFGCEGQCEILKDCVHCQIFPESEAEAEQRGCSEANCTFDIQGVDKLDDYLREEEEMRPCSYLDAKGCKYIFAYKVVPTGKHLVLAERTKACPKSQLLVYVGGVIGGTVLLGLLALLLFKLITSVRDHMEWARFKKEQELRKWSNSENPLYKNAVSTFENPTFRRHRSSKLQQ